MSVGDGGWGGRLFVIIFSLWKPLTSIAGSSVSDVAVVLNTSLYTTFNLLALDPFNTVLSFHFYMVYLFSFFCIRG